MGLPNRLKSARLTNATAGSAIDDQVGLLEVAACDITGIPVDTDIAAALFEVVAAGLKSVYLQDAAAAPTVAGQIRRNGSELQWFNGERAVDLQPAGEYKWMAAGAAPAGWLLCDGSEVAQATYARLFARVGTTFNAGGEGAGNFRLPNIKGRVLVGRDAGQTEFDVLGETGGEKTHVLTLAESAAHTHTYQNGNTGTPTAGTAAAVMSDVNSGAGGVTSSAGGGAAHNNLQPYIVANCYIST